MTEQPEQEERQEGRPERPGQSGQPREATEPLAVPMPRIVAWGLLAWAVALVVTLAVPALHTGERWWWPWSCVAGIVGGAVAWVYLHRGRGNAAG